MRHVLVPFDGRKYLAIDKVALARTATAVLKLLPGVERGDAYHLGALRDLLKRAIDGQVDTPLSSRNEIISARYFVERREGTLPAEFTAEFDASLSRFLVRALSLPLDEPKLQTVDGQVMALMEMEDPGDWPSKVRHE